MNEGTKASFISLKAFYVRRALRILPPFWLYLITLALLGLAGVINVPLSQIGISTLFLSNFATEELPWVLCHTWSLSNEEQFYLIYPLLFLQLGFTSKPRILLMGLSMTVILSVGLSILGVDSWANYLSNINFLMTGCAGALYWDRLSPICRSLSVKSWLMVLVSLIACVGLLPNSIDIYLKTLFYPSMIGLVVLGTPNQNTKFKAFFQNSLLAYLGKISYSVYLWQQLATAPYPILSPWYTVLFVLCTWIFAICSYEYFERPLINIASRWSDVIKQRVGVSPGFTK